MYPSLGNKLSVFIALAPCVYAGPLTTGFLFTTLNRLEWSTWKRFFGVLDFIPLMRWAYDYAPPKLFVSLGSSLRHRFVADVRTRLRWDSEFVQVMVNAYKCSTMFAFLFKWTDANWYVVESAEIRHR